VDFSPALIWSWYNGLINGSSTEGPPNPKNEIKKPSTGRRQMKFREVPWS